MPAVPHSDAGRQLREQERELAAARARLRHDAARPLGENLEAGLALIGLSQQIAAGFAARRR